MDSLTLFLLIIAGALFMVVSACRPIIGLGTALVAMQFGQFLKPQVAGRTLLLSLSDIAVSLLLFTVVIPHLIRNGLPFRRSPVWRSWLVYAVVILPSIFAATDILRWAAGARIIAQDFIVFAACLSAIRKPRQAKGLVITLVAWGCLTVLVLCANVFGGTLTYATILATKETDVSFARSNYLAAILLLIVPISLHLYTAVTGRRGQVALLCANLMLIGGIVLTKSRGGMLVLAGYLLMFLLKGKKGAVRKFAGAVIVVALGLAGAAIVPGILEETVGTIPAVGDVASDRNMVARQYLWEQNVAAFLEHPVIGNGLLNTLVDRNITGWSAQASMEAHNYVLQVLAETGVVGFFGFSFLWVTVILDVARSRSAFGLSDWRAGLTSGTLGSIGTAFVHGLIENNLLTKEFGLVQWMIIGITVASVGLRQRQTTWMPAANAAHTY